MSKTFVIAFYNLDNNRPVDQTNKEILAFLKEGGPRPAVFGLCETGNTTLPDHADYRKIRDTTREGRDNIMAYVKKSLEFDPDTVKWFDCKETWHKTEGPGEHWARSWLEFRFDGCQCLVGHQPPKGTNNVQASQQEGVDLMVKRMAPWTRDDWDDRTEEDKKKAKAQPRVVIADMNRTCSEDGPGPKVVANKIDGGCVGGKIDMAVKRQAAYDNVRYPDNVNGVALKSDHGHAFLFDLTVD